MRMTFIFIMAPVFIEVEGPGALPSLIPAHEAEVQD
jgi:hypothetical protein